MGRSCAWMEATSSERVAAAPPDEEAALRAALVSAGQQIAKLAEAVGGDAAQILEFQVALLEDDDFLDPIFAAIVEGSACAHGLVVRPRCTNCRLQCGRRRVPPGALLGLGGFA